MLIQIGGIILLSISLVCLTWLVVTRWQMQTKAEQTKTDKRNAHAERMAQANWSVLYEEEKQRRIDAETREKIAKDQLRRAREQMAKVKIKEAE
jgi:hypothetical protein